MMGILQEMEFIYIREKLLGLSFKVLMKMLSLIGELHSE